MKLEADLSFNLLPEVSDACSSALQDVLDKGAADITATAVRNAIDLGIFDTGNLVGGIGWDEAPEATPDEPANQVFVEAEYAPVHEFGGHGNEARPFFYPAFLEHRDYIVANVGPAILAGIK